MSTGARRSCGIRTTDGQVPNGSVTAGPITGSSKSYRELADVTGARVPFRRVNLSDGKHLDLYDTSGPYTDAGAVIDPATGLPPRERRGR